MSRDPEQKKLWIVLVDGDPKQLPAETGSILVSGIDCKVIPRRKTAQERVEPKPKHLKKGQKRQKKKMATIASVHTALRHHRTPEEVAAALMDPGAPAAEGEKPRPEHRRLWASVLKSKDAVIQEVVEEMDRRDPSRQKTALCLMDGSALFVRVLSNA